MAQIAFSEFLKRRERGAVGLPTNLKYCVREALNALLVGRSGLVKDVQQEQLKTRAERLCAIVGLGTPIAKLTELWRYPVNRCQLVNA